MPAAKPVFRCSLSLPSPRRGLERKRDSTFTRKLGQSGVISIRPYLAEDIPHHCEAVRASLPELIPFLPWCHADYSIDDSRQWIEAQIAAFAQNKEYAFAIIGADGGFIGSCGLNHLDRENGLANLGYWIRTSEQGRGQAAQAAQLVQAWAFANTALERIEIMASVANRASQRVAEKIGAQREGLLRRRLRLHGTWHDAVLYSLIRDRA
jgi:RimJ/RimL family protein N-acetyltransferase